MSDGMLCSIRKSGGLVLMTSHAPYQWSDHKFGQVVRFVYVLAIKWERWRQGQCCFSCCCAYSWFCTVYSTSPTLRIDSSQFARGKKSKRCVRTRVLLPRALRRPINRERPLLVVGRVRYPVNPTRARRCSARLIISVETYKHGHITNDTLLSTRDAGSDTKTLLMWTCGCDL